MKLQWDSSKKYFYSSKAQTYPLSYSPQVLIELLLAIRLFQKKSKQGGNSRQNEASPWKFKGEGEIPTPETKGEIPRPETKTFGNFTIFSCSPLEFPHSFFSISLAIPCPLPPCLNFFWKVNLRNALFKKFCATIF